jgi:phosphoglycerate dehydrogenase-like enzyme
MSKVNVLITRKIGEQDLHRILAVSPQIKVHDVSDWIEEEGRGDTDATRKLNRVLAETEVIYGFAPPRNILTRAPKLKWIHTMLAGVERILDANMTQSSVIITNGKGIHDTPCAETALMMMLMLTKNAPMYFIDKQEKKWQKLPGRVLHSKTVGIVGLGSIGNEIARLCKSFRMRVIGVRRNLAVTTRTRYVDSVMPINQLHEMLAESDYVVLALPYTRETDKLIG